MTTRKIYFQPSWSIEIYTGVEEIVQRMGWAMDMAEENGIWVGTVNLPIEDEKLWDIIERGWMEYDG